MAKAKRIVASPGRGSVVEEGVKVTFTEEEESETEQRKGDGRYAKSDLDKIRKIHFLVTQLFHQLGVPWAFPHAFQPGQATLQSGYSYSPTRLEQEMGQLRAMGASAGIATWGGLPVFSPIAPSQPLYLATYPTWNLIPGMTVAGR